jgi:flagellin-like hook-associated protein FlgL
MRVTNSILHNNFLFNLGRRREEQARLQDQISSGKQFVRPSQDPLHIGRSLTLRTSIKLNNRLSENIQQAQTLANVQDDNLNQVNEIVQRIRELGVRAANTHLSPEQFDAIAREVEQLTEQVVTIGNYSNGEKFVFGGHQTHLPPFDARKDVVIGGTDLFAMGLDALAGTQVPVVKRIPVRDVAAGPFAIPDGALSINGYDIGAINLPDPTRTSADNALSLADRINSFTDRTGVSGVVVATPPGFAVQLEATDRNGVPTGKEILVAGTDQGKVTGIYNGESARNQVQAFGSVPVSFPAADLTGSDLVINGIPIGNVTLSTAPTMNQVAQRLVDAINAKSTQTGVTASTNTNGRLILSSIGESISFTTTANGATVTGLPTPVAPALPTDPVLVSHLTGNAVVPSGPLSFDRGSLTINGIDIFDTSVAINNPPPSTANASVLAGYINAKANDTGVRAKADANGVLHLSSAATVTTAVNYVGDSGKVNTESGVNDRVATNIPGDVAFSGSRAIISMAGTQYVPAGAIGNLPPPALPQPSLVPGQMVINGVDVMAGFVPTSASNTDAQNAQALVSQINTFSAQTGVIASVSPDEPNRLVLTSRGSTIDVATGVPGLNPMAATGIAVGKTQSQNSVYQALLSFRESLVNAKYKPETVGLISLTNIREINESLENIANVRSVLGAQANRLEKSGERLSALNVTDQSLLSENEDTDYHEALTQLSQEEMVYRAALGVGSRILPPSLMDFLR